MRFSEGMGDLRNGVVVVVGAAAVAALSAPEPPPRAVPEAGASGCQS